MRHRECMRDLRCMRTPVRCGVMDGAIDVTSTAGGKSRQSAHIGAGRGGKCQPTFRSSSRTQFREPRLDMSRREFLALGSAANRCAARRSPLAASRALLRSSAFCASHQLPVPRISLAHLVRA